MVKSHCTMEHILKRGCTEWRFAYEPGVLKAVCGEAECMHSDSRKSSRAVCKCIVACRRNYNKEEVMQIEVSLTDENGVLAAEDLEITAEV